MKITIRKYPLKDNRSSLYLDIYKNGTRTKEYLGLYVFDRPENNVQKEHSEKNRMRAERLRLNLLEKYQEELALKKINTPQVDTFLDSYIESEKLSKISLGHWNGLKKHLRAFFNYSPPHLEQLEPNFQEKFAKYLRSEGLKQNTIHQYIKKLDLLCQQAMNKHSKSPQFISINTKAEEKNDRDLLTVEELKLLSQKAPKHPLLLAIKLGAMTGLSISELLELTYKDIALEDNKVFFKIGANKIPIFPTVLKFLDERKMNTSSKILPLLKYSRIFNKQLKEFIQSHLHSHKVISFSSLKYTYIMILLSRGFDIYEITKFIRVKSIATTQKYLDYIHLYNTTYDKPLDNFDFEL
ncbi:phage integrase SAM-like domain-containing protein [Aureibacter tunicatorum]|uniref:Integrase n=1 Tax=Aureibacter tunicatorum TaxID=866807 RepID=A0AAE3XQ79_9BACT|nr:phage integrase SAM-like domain-containing protein [Aureibacter tunicatorum]MDR6239359.1 integrase [Aureibacter tunicatorum]BDD04718.1 tyrosine recombinase [Aureibacter tunicatorum]